MSSRSDPLTITINSELLDLNAYIRLERSPRKGYLIAASRKRELTEAVAWEAKAESKGRELNGPCSFVFRWYAPNRRKDPDNIAFARKFIMDGIVDAGILPNDTWRYVKGFQDQFYVDKEHPRVEITICPQEKR